MGIADARTSRSWFQFCAPLVLPVAVCYCSCRAQAPGLQVVLSQDGISSLRVGGREYLHDGAFRVGHIDMRTPAGVAVAADLRSSVKADAEQSLIQREYSWGSISIHYKASGERLSFDITTANRSANTIEHVFYEPLTLKLPKKPVEYDGSVPLLAVNMGDPTVISLTSAGSNVLLSNEDVQRPLVAGFPWALDKPVNTIFPLRVNTGRDNMYPDSLPEVVRPIPPGTTDTFHLSLTFEPQSTGARSGMLPVYQTFRSTFPMQMQWKDRRPIGQLILGRSGTGWKTNPRGWFLDEKLDVGTAAGAEEFRRRVLEFADHSVLYLQNLNAQGMVTWDIEGEQYPQPTSYVGDPRLLDLLAPEMASVADEYFARFRKAGFRVGVCIRPQTFTLAGNLSARQEENANPAQTLIEKIRYAQRRWGASIFYVDSNGSPSYPLDVHVFQEIARAVPDVLLIPEHANTAYYSVAAPYTELRSGSKGTTGPVLKLYPTAFSVVNVTDGNLDQKYAAMEKAVKQGDTLMTRAWFADPTIDQVRSVYSYLP